MVQQTGATASQQSLAPAIVRIYGSDRTSIQGAGFLVGSRQIITCADILSEPGGSAPDGPIALDFPLIAPGRLLAARVAAWRPQAKPGDLRLNLALLELTSDPPADARPIWLVQAADLSNHPCRVYGFPASYDHGVWSSGLLRADPASGHVQLGEIKTAVSFAQSGFSGSPVWDDALNGVVGMLVIADRADVAIGPGGEQPAEEPANAGLRQRLTDYFNTGELQNLCFDLGIDYESLPGQGKPDKARELVAYVRRYGQTGALLDACRRLRPNVDWPDLPQLMPIDHTATGHAPRAAYLIPAGLLITAIPALNKAALPPCPYRGLASFREEDEAFFFGRESYTARMYDAVHRQSILAILGPSGSGKSSVVFAGLIPQLRRSGQWTIVSFRPGDRPLRSLAAAVVPLLEPKLTEVDLMIESEKLEQALRDNKLRLSQVISRIASRPDASPRLLLVADQIEEILTLCHDAEERRAVIEQLLEAFHTLPTDQPPRAVLALMMRADFMPVALGYRALADALQDSSLLLGPMNADELRNVIEHPAKQLGVGLEYGLTQRILDTVVDAPGNLPLLQFALAKLWERQEQRQLTHAAYDAIGGVEHAVTQYADQVIDRLGADQRSLARQVLIQLVQPGETTEDTRRVARREEMGSAAWELAAELASARLVVTGQSTDGTQTAEIIHEALIGGWQTLREWMQEDRAFRRWQEGLRASMRQWEENRRDPSLLLRSGPLVSAEDWLAKHSSSLSEREQEFIKASSDRRKLEQGRRRQLYVALSIVTALAIVLLVFFLMRAESEQERAEAQFRQAQARALASQSAYYKSMADQLHNTWQFSQETSHKAADFEQLALLLAIEAVEQTHRVDGSVTVEANAALRNLLDDSVSKTLTSTMPLYIRFSPDGSRVAYAGNADVEIWPIGAPEPVHVDSLPADALLNAGISAINFDPSGTRIVIADPTGETRIIDSQTGAVISRLQIGGAVAYSLFDRTGTLVAATSPSANKIVVWDAQSGTQRWSVNEFSNMVAFSPTEDLLATPTRGIVKLWNAQTGAPIGELPSPEGVTTYVRGAFSPDGKYFIAGSIEGVVPVWDVAKKTIIHELRGHRSVVYDVAYSPDGRLIATTSGGHIDRAAGSRLNAGGGDGTARIWDAASGKELFVLPSDADDVWAVAFSPDSKMVATGGADNVVRIWNAATGQMIALLPDFAATRLLLTSSTVSTSDSSAISSDQPIEWVFDIDFSPDGTRVAAAGSAAGVSVYMIDIDQVLGLARRGVTRDWTCEERVRFLFEHRDCPAESRAPPT